MKNEHIESGRKNQKLNTRDKILEATRKQLEKKVPLTMEGIAENAGISRATIYRYYTNTDAISMDLLLQLDVPNTDTVFEKNKEASPRDAILSIQKAYLDFSFRNEQTSRKFLAAVLSSPNSKMKRGQNRITTLRNYFASHKTSLSEEEKEKLIHVSVLLMGIESVITAKDVCGLDDETAANSITWGLEMILKGCRMDK
ncbi:TetR/AcrR family transcriptional regulator [Flagellimonas crocea]|uniref:TetR/AcrR family transcriptional regulator n=1 Tax=Flagellimonas crocea TaxID=3067311 RepID=UPI00296F01FA|nr:TetR/AcrR family transcriptional regulator [Muricauda sp. DH64]